MIIGIGVDLVEIDRIKKSSIENLVKRILTEKEIQIYNQFKNEKRKWEFLAGRYAAKEAYSKALGTGIGEISFKDIEVINDNKGKPYIDINNNTIIHLTITHTESYALAFVVIEE
ncbi:MAG TPA: holo-ACP synthase [Haloplasmataceae bacterium]